MPSTTADNHERLANALRELGARLRVAGLTDDEARQLPVIIDAANCTPSAPRRGPPTLVHWTCFANFPSRESCPARESVAGRLSPDPTASRRVGFRRGLGHHMRQVTLYQATAARWPLRGCSVHRSGQRFGVVVCFDRGDGALDGIFGDDCRGAGAVAGVAVVEALDGVFG